MALERVKMTRCSSKESPRLCSSNTVVAHSTYDPKIKGPNPVASNRRVKTVNN
jgi:hypothetical protein